MLVLLLMLTREAPPDALLLTVNGQITPAFGPGGQGTHRDGGSQSGREAL